MNMASALTEFERLAGEPLPLLAVELTLILVLFVIARYSHGWWSGVNTREELAERDNIAFGISLAGGLTGLCLVLSGVFHLPGPDTLLLKAVWIGGTGLVTLILIRLGRWWYDKLALNHVDKHGLILEGNIAMALVDAAIAIATAVVLLANLRWLGEISLASFFLLCLDYFIALTLLVGVTRILEYRYRRVNQGGSLQRALAQDHRAVALRHSAYLLACGHVIASAGQLNPYHPTTPVLNVAGWLLWSAVGLGLLFALSSGLRYLVLAQIKVSREVELQNNSGIAILDGALVFASALLLSNLIQS
ncbi:DUF350 domain-containing protein [Marinobacter hydrocarbonoclasticus]|nr:DUF350 domain-containing protein [Marinobacter nauticus]